MKRSSKFVGVEPSLISEARTIIPGQTFTVALSLKHEAPYHTYWVNPGMVGVASGINWTLPEGFSAGDIQWQAPERTVMIIYNSHGYKGDALLLVDITAPETLPAGPLILNAQAFWMTCAQKTCCNVGFENFELRLNAGEKIEWNTEARNQIAKARRNLPRPVTGWKYSGVRVGNKLILVARNSEGLHIDSTDGLYFFSEINYTDTLLEQEFEVNGSEITAILPISDVAPEKVERVSGLFYNPAGWPGANGRKYMLVSFQLQ
jgi:thiol:disulfide interchange protein DsbD